MTQCPTCGQNGYEPDETKRNLLKLDWDVLYYETSGTKRYDTAVGDIEVVFTPEAQEFDSYGGEVEDDTYVVIQTLIDGRFWRRDVSRDSYGTRDWSSDIREVKAQPRTITVYDYA